MRSCNDSDKSICCGHASQPGHAYRHPDQRNFAPTAAAIKIAEGRPETDNTERDRKGEADV